MTYQWTEQDDEELADYLQFMDTMPDEPPCEHTQNWKAAGFMWGFAILCVVLAGLLGK